MVRAGADDSLISSPPLFSNAPKDVGLPDRDANPVAFPLNAPKPPTAGVLVGVVDVDGVTGAKADLLAPSAEGAPNASPLRGVGVAGVLVEAPAMPNTDTGFAGVSSAFLKNGESLEGVVFPKAPNPEAGFANGLGAVLIPLNTLVGVFCSVGENSTLSVGVPVGVEMMFAPPNTLLACSGFAGVSGVDAEAVLGGAPKVAGAAPALVSDGVVEPKAGVGVVELEPKDGIADDDPKPEVVTPAEPNAEGVEDAKAPKPVAGLLSPEEAADPNPVGLLANAAKPPGAEPVAAGVVVWAAAARLFVGALAKAENPPAEVEAGVDMLGLPNVDDPKAG